MGKAGGERERFGFSLAHLMLQKLMLNNIFMHGWSCYPAHHSHISARKDVLFISEDVSFYDRDMNARQGCFFYGILLCCRGSKCKHFTDPLWSFHTDCQGLQSLNSPEIKKRGTGESNHFSTSSLPDLPSLTHAPVWGEKMKTLHPKWQIRMGCEGCIQATLTLRCLNVALQHFIISELTVHCWKHQTSTVVKMRK